MTHINLFNSIGRLAIWAILTVGFLSPPAASAQDRDGIKGSIAVTKGANLKSLAKISEKQARTAALAKYPGSKVSEVDLENEDGYLVYTVELKHEGEEIEVLVDAGNGTVLKAVDEDGEQVMKEDEDDEQDENDEEEEDEEEGGSSASVELPQAVQMAFRKSWPNARITGSDVEETDGTTYYEVESIDGEKHRDLLYYADGRVYETEEALTAQELPALVRSAAMKHGKIVKAEKITRGTSTEFEVLVEMGESQHELVLDASGKVLKMSTSEEKD